MIVFFDGRCSFCYFAVHFISAYDKRNLFFFAPLEGETAKRILPSSRPDSLAFFDGQEIFYQGAALLKIVRLLPFPIRLCQVFSVLPISWINGVYNFIARRRKKLVKCEPSELEEIDPSKLLP